MTEFATDGRRTPRAVVGSSEAERPISLTVRVLDVSMSGALLVAPTGLAPGQRAELRATLGGKPLVAEIEVRRTVVEPTDERSREARSVHMGVAFVSLDERSQRTVERFLGQKTST